VKEEESETLHLLRSPANADALAESIADLEAGRGVGCKYDTADHLKTNEDVASYIDTVLEDGDPELLKVALGNIARAMRKHDGS